MVSSFHLFSNMDAEARFLVRQWVRVGDAVHILLLPESERVRLLHHFLRYGVEAGLEVGSFWLGSLWDVSVVRGLLKALRREEQRAVLRRVEVSIDELVTFRGEADLALYRERDIEALNCFRELLEPGESVMSFETWRELAEVCQSTTLSVGVWPWKFEVLTEQDAPPENCDHLWLPNFVRSPRKATSALPQWVKEAKTITATAARRDFRGQTLYPWLAEAEKLGWSVQSHVVKEEEPRPPVELVHAAILKDSLSLEHWHRALDEQIYSVSALETYAQSPYWYFAQRLLRLEPLEEATRDVEHVAMGRVVHRVLELMFRDSLFSSLDELVAAEFKALSDAMPMGSVLLLKQDEQRVVRALRGLLEKERRETTESSLQPRYFEWSFGDGQTPPLEISGADGKSIRLRGRVDRIDVDPEAKTFLILDYKTGSSRVTAKDIERGTALQLPVYIEAVKRLLLPDYEAIGGFYYSLADLKKQDGMVRLDLIKEHFDLSMRSSSVMTPEKFAGLIEGSLEQVRRIVAQLYAGSFPRTEGICASYCPYRDMCGCRQCN